MGSGVHALIFAALLTSSGHAGTLSRLTARFPDLPPPPQGSTHWVAPSMRMNGLPMTLKTFESRLPPDNVLHFYATAAQRWGHSEFRRSNRGSRRVLSIRARDHVITIEADEDLRGSTGTIAVSGLPERAALVADSRFPRPTTARLVNVQQYEDEGIESEHLSLSSARSIAVESAAFSDVLAREGWQIVRQQPMQTASRGMVIEVQRGAEQALLTLQTDRAQPAATAIVIVWRKS